MGCVEDGDYADSVDGAVFGASLSNRRGLVGIGKGWISIWGMGTCRSAVSHTRLMPNGSV